MTLLDWFTLLLPLFFACVLLWGRRKSREPLAQTFGTTIDREVPLEVAAGIAIGGIVMVGIFGIEWALGAIQVTGVGGPAGIWWAWLAFLVVAALLEEILSRSFLLGGLISLLRRVKWVAVAISALYFGLAHLGNPNASAVSVVGNALGGVMYAVAFLGTGRLWMAFGLHFSWNFFQGPVVGFPVSGMEMPSLIELATTGSEWITGGAYGPEAGAVGMTGRFAVIALLFAWFRWRHAEKSWGDLLRFE